jgi:dihydrofolate reductase
VLIADLSISLDGFVAGPDQTLEQPLGRGGEKLHEWIFGLESWRRSHGLEGGERNEDSDIVAEHVEAMGAVIMGRRMFSGGDGPWESDPNAASWFGDDPPFRVPVFVLTHHAREPETFANGTSYTFVTEGIEHALEQARAAGGDKNVSIHGGASVVQQYLRAGLLDALQVHVVPILLGGGVHLFGALGEDTGLEIDRVVASPAVTHLRYRVTRPPAA